MTTIAKAYGWENIQSGKCPRVDVHSAKFPMRKCRVGKVSVEELSFGEVSVWDLSIGKYQPRRCPNTNLSVKPSQKNCLKSSKKEQMTSCFCREPWGKSFSLSRRTTYGYVIFKGMTEGYCFKLSVRLTYNSSCFKPFCKRSNSGRRAPSKKLPSSKKAVRKMLFLNVLPSGVSRGSPMPVYSFRRPNYVY